MIAETLGLSSPLARAARHHHPSTLTKVSHRVTPSVHDYLPVCLNPVAWRLSSTEGYRLLKPITSKITNLLYIDDLKVFALLEAKMKRVQEMAQVTMGEIGLQWNPKKCIVLHVRRGSAVQDSERCEVGTTSVDCIEGLALSVSGNTRTVIAR